METQQNLRGKENSLALKSPLWATTITLQKEKEKKKQGEQAPRKLQSFRHLPSNIKIHLTKTMVFLTLDYPPIPTHSLSITQLRRLQRT